MLRALFLIVLLSSTAGLADEAKSNSTPKSLDPELEVSLFAEHPQLVTPTGIDVDSKGRVWVIESNTHFPPDGYAGHKSDRVLVMSAEKRNARADNVVTFADGFTHAMSIAVRSGELVDANRKRGTAPGPDRIYVATRREIVVMTDTNTDNKADSRKRIVQLETPGNYPHNGLGGFAFDALGWMYFGLGENLGADYTLTGSDGTKINGGGEGGSVFRCRLDGSKLTRWATGFWNPHASCIDAFGRMFTVDNDADSRPPCRLLHIVRNGDYGYRFRNGRKGLHPFTAWNGEIPGTLPMVSGTGEAPSGIVAYESDAFPATYRGTLLVGSWGDHRIDVFRLKRNGASFRSAPEPLIVGGEDFRPVGLAVAPNGDLFFSDWVKRDYKVHGHGRVWRVSPVKSVDQPRMPVLTKNPNAVGRDKLLSHLRSADLPTRRLAAQRMATVYGRAKDLQSVMKTNGFSDRARIESLWALAATDGSWGFNDVSIMDAHGGDIDRMQSPLVLEALRLVLAYREDSNQDLDVTIHGLKTAGVLPKRNRPLFLALARSMPVNPTSGASRVLDLANDGDPFLLAAAVEALANSDITATTIGRIFRTSRLGTLTLAVGKPRHRLAFALAARRKFSKDASLAALALSDDDTAVVRAAVQWIAEEQLNELKPAINDLFNGPNLTDELFWSTLAAVQMLDGVNPAEIDRTPPTEFLAKIAFDEKREPGLRAKAVRYVGNQDEKIVGQLYTALAKTDDDVLRLELVRTLQNATSISDENHLRDLAASTDASAELRADAMLALVGRAAKTTDPKLAKADLDAVSAMLEAGDRDLQFEAARSLARWPKPITFLPKSFANTTVKLDDSSARFLELIDLARTRFKKDSPAELLGKATARPTSTAGWLDKTAEGGDVAAGRRAFFHVFGTGCFKCHTVNGRGGKIGPDLSTIGRSLDRKKLAESILEPSREIAPQFTTYAVVTNAGKTFAGMIVGDDGDHLTLGDTEGKQRKIKHSEIEKLVPQKISVMPKDLAANLTVSEFRDVLAYLESLQ